jgi:hypothetical protein
MTDETTQETNTSPTDAAVVLSSDGTSASVDPNVDRSGDDTAGGDDLILGKFKTVEDMQAAYVALEKKLGTNTGDDGNGLGDGADDADPGAGDDGDGSGPGEPDGEPEGGSDEGSEFVYSEQLDAVLTNAEIDPKALAESYEADGEISEGDYEKLAKAGYPKEMVDAYISGLQKSAGETVAVTEAQIAEIKGLAGGDEGFSKVQKFIAETYTKEGVDAYNAVLNTGDVTKVKAAVGEAVAAYQKAMGTEGDLLGGNKAATTGYADQAEFLEDMKNPQYKTSQAFRNAVDRKLAASPNLGITR